MITIRKKLLAIALSLAVGVTFIPLLGSNVYAETETENPAEVILDEGDGNAGDDVDVPIDGEEGEDGDIVDITPDENIVEDDVVEDSALSDETTTPDNPVINELAGETRKMDASAKDAYTQALGEDSIKPMASIYTITSSRSGNKLNLKATITDSNYQFSYLFIDLKYTAVPAELAAGFSGPLDLTSYGTGYHTVAVGITSTTDTSNLVDVWEKRFIPVNTVTAKPNYSGKFYYVYSKYFEFYPFNFGKNLGSDNLYMEYKIKGAKKWKRSGYMKANSIKLYAEQGYTIKKLKPNKTYQTRLRYGKYVTYSTSIGGDGKSYFFGGPVRNTKTIKTGNAKKPTIKSVTVKAVKVKKHKVKHPAYWYYVGGAAFYHKAWTEKYYTYKVKVTVKLKKKPGAAGIWINGKFVKGNKKKYTVTLPGSSYSAKKPKGKKFKVNVCSYKGKSYGGLSPLYKKTKKIK